ncbi:putative transcriptional regulator [Candidatus Sulfopaludibacter sp. SbA4]|nr:putative transcriptional regulator [Candidatus Sulfopaludibacter sp. SbA4]
MVLSLTEQRRSVVRAADVIDMLGSEPTARKVIRNLLRKGWLSRLIGGRYMFLPPEHGPENLGENNVLALASAAVDPSYVGWWSAASFHGLTTQKPMSITVATLRQIPARMIEGAEIRFVKLTNRKFFGSAVYNVYGRDVAISTPAKTVVDCLDRPDLAGGPAELTRIVYGSSATVDAEEIGRAAVRMKSTALLQRLGFLTDLVGWRWPDNLRGEIRSAIPKSARSVLGRMKRQEDDIGYVADWGLFVNAPRHELLTDVPQRELGI